MKTIYNILSMLLFVAIFSACKKDTKAPEPEPLVTPAVATGQLKLEFGAVVGTSSLTLSTATYTNQAGNTFNVTLFKYYISNIKLVKNDNTIWAEPNSYHLIDHSDAATTLLTLTQVPFSDYKSISFMIGVDSAKNNSGAQTADLDPTKGMFWSWNSGYIMAKIEGTSPQSTVTANSLLIHVGGFMGVNSVLKTVSPSFNGSVAKVSDVIIPVIHVKTDLMEWFQSPYPIDFSILNTVHMPGAEAKKIADNYADMFSIDYIHNN